MDAGTPAPLPVNEAKNAATGTLPKDEIKKVVFEHRENVMKCYESRLATTPQLAGKLIVQFIIGPTGDVSSVTTTEDTLKSGPVETCIHAHVRTWRFPKPTGGNNKVLVNFPFVFGQKK